VDGDSEQLGPVEIRSVLTLTAAAWRSGTATSYVSHPSGFAWPAVPAWLRHVLNFADTHHIVLPHTYRPPDMPPPAAGRAAASAASAARAPSTIRSLRSPMLRLVSFIGTRAPDAVPPPADVVTQFLQGVFETSSTAGAVSSARQAAAYLARINGWTHSHPDGVAATLADAAMRQRRTAPVRAPAIPPAAISALLQRWILAPEAPLGHVIVAAMIVVSWHFLLRVGEAQALTWADIVHVDDPPSIRLRLASRKTHQRAGQWLTMARRCPDGSPTAASDAIAELQRRLPHRQPEAPLFPDVSPSTGHTTDDTRMTYEHFRQHLSRALSDVQCRPPPGTHFTSHSMRAGGATAAYQASLAIQDINAIAGVRSPDWISRYYDPDVAHRTAATSSFAVSSPTRTDPSGAPNAS